MPNAGVKPGKGTYICTVCRQIVVLNDNNNKLPYCPKCYSNTYKKSN